MKATEKMDSYGIKALAEHIGVDLVTVYRWRRALANGKGVSDDNKRRLVDATAASPAPIVYADFFPADAANAVQGAAAASDARP